MKRKKAMAFNAPGGTFNYIGASCQNLVRNGCYMLPVSSNIGCDIYCGTDYSYTQFGGVPSRIFRKKFNIMDFDFVDKFDLYDCLISLGRLESGIGRVPLYVFWFNGWRIVVEFFDKNAVVDFTNQIDNEQSRDDVMNYFVKKFGSHYKVTIINEHLINVSE